MAIETYRVTVTGYLANEFVQSVFHFTGPNTGPEPSYLRAKNLLDALNDPAGWINFFMEMVPEDYKASSLSAQRVSVGGGPKAVILADLLATSVGQRSGNISSAQANPLIIWIPAEAPSKVGKTFVPGVSEDDIDEMLLTGDLIGAINNFTDAHIAGVTVSADELDGSVFRRATHDGDGIDYARVSPLIGTQRKRLHPV